MAVAGTASMMVVWPVAASDATSITGALQALLRNTNAEPGCEGCQLTTEIGDVVTIRYQERWRSEADLQRQIRSARFAALAELTERGTKAPVVEFVVGGNVRGLDYADEVRAASRR